MLAQFDSVAFIGGLAETAAAAPAPFNWWPVVVLLLILLLLTCGLMRLLNKKRPGLKPGR